MNAAKSLQRNVVTRHRHLSASNDVLSTLPERVVKGFPLVMQQRSDFTLRVFGYVITGTYQGQNFIEQESPLGILTGHSDPPHP